MDAYRLKNCIRAVKLDSDGHGQFLMLAPGSIVRLGGSSSLRGFVEIVCGGEKLSVFREDLEDKGERVSGAPASATQRERNL